MRTVSRQDLTQNMKGYTCSILNELLYLTYYAYSKLEQYLRPSQQTTIIRATATDTQHAFLSKTNYATTEGEALWTLSNGWIRPNECYEQFKIGYGAISNKIYYNYYTYY